MDDRKLSAIQSDSPLDRSPREWLYRGKAAEMRDLADLTSNAATAPATRKGHATARRRLG